MEKLIFKLGFYSIYEIKTNNVIKYKVDSGKTLFIAKFNKTIFNPYRDVKEFDKIDDAKKYVNGKLKANERNKKKKVEKLPKSLYLVLIKEEISNTIFVKVGITSKKFIMRRFSKAYGYEGYILETIIRRIDTPYAEKCESEIKEVLNKKRSIKKYRPLLKNFSGYSECFNYLNLDEIIEVFDRIAKKY
jgi:hypothetical protein